MKNKILAVFFIIIISISFIFCANAEEIIVFEANSVSYDIINNEKTSAETFEIFTTKNSENETEDILGVLDDEQKNFLKDFFKNATPDEISKIQEIIVSGLEALRTEDNTFFDKITDFILSHVTETSWVIFAIALVLYVLVILKKYKGFEKISMLLNNNAIDISNLCEKTVSEAKEKISENTEKLNQSTAELTSAFTSNIDNCICEISKITGQTLGAIENNTNIVLEALNYIKSSEEEKNNLLKMFSSQISEKENKIADLEEKQEIERSNTIKSEILLADIINELLQLSNIPQIKKDAIFEKYKEAKNNIEVNINENFENTEQT